MPHHAAAPKKLSKRIHKTSHSCNVHGQPKHYNYCIVIPHIPNLYGLSDALTNIIFSYSDHPVFGKPILNTGNGYISDARPQTIIANHSNYNNMISDISTTNYTDECSESIILRKNINLYRLYRHEIFWAMCQNIQDNLFISLLAHRMPSNNNSYLNLFAWLPEELISKIILAINNINLFSKLE